MEAGENMAGKDSHLDHVSAVARGEFGMRNSLYTMY